MRPRQLSITWISKLILFPFFLSSYSYKLSICTMFKDEAPWIREWIEYHRLINVDHFYLYSNDSSDNYMEILDSYIQSGIVELISWNSNSSPFHDPRQPVQWVGFQLSAFNDCIQRATGISKWLAFVDIDEYIISLKEPSEKGEYLHLLLDEISPDIGSVTLFWRNFGTSGVWEIPQNSLMIELLNMRAKDEEPENQHCKCIHRPEAVLYTLVHEAFLKPDYKQARIDPSDIRINHYYLRDQKNCLERRSFEPIECLEARFNYIYDTSMLRFIRPLHEKMHIQKNDK